MLLSLNNQLFAQMNFDLFVSEQLVDKLLNISKMGEKQSKSLRDELTLDPKDWITTKQMPDRQILTNVRSNREGQQVFILTQPNEDLEHELQIYYYRKVQQSALVEVYGVENMNKKSKPLCGNSDSIKVVYERIPRRLGNLQKLSFPQALYFLSQCFRGFKDCYQKVGLFEVTEDMVGVNTEGVVKVWLNENFALNHPTSERPSLQITSTVSLKNASGSQQKIMVDNVVQLIQNRTEIRFPSSFKFRMKQALSFVDAYCEIEQYVRENEMWIPDRLPSSSVLQKERRSQSRISEFKSQLKNYRSSNMNSNVNSNVSQPHATYIPNVQYCEPRMTYVQSPKASREGPHLRTIQVSYHTSSNVSNNDNFSQNAVSSLPPYYVSSPKNQIGSPKSNVGSPPSLKFESNASKKYISPPQSPKIRFLHGQNFPTSPKS